MNQNNNTMSLLDYLTEKTGCNYISDLSRPSSLPGIKEAISEIDAASFSLKQWSEAVNYICKEKHFFETESVARDFLLNLKD